MPWPWGLVGTVPYREPRCPPSRAGERKEFLLATPGRVFL